MPGFDRPAPATSRVGLPDGRRLAFAEFGDPAGRPIFFFHGTPGSRLMRHPDDGIARALGVRLLTTDRPGYGRSDAKPGRRLLDWPGDVACLADTLGIDQFAVIGLSGGGPHALACAYRLPGRVRAAAVLSGAGPMDRRGAMAGMMAVSRVGLGLAGRVPPWLIAEPARAGYRLIRRNPRLVLAGIAAAMPGPDRAVLSRPDVFAVSLATMGEAFATGTQGLADDLAVLARPWGFRLADVRVPVYLWHGDRDVNIPIQTAHYLARHLPHCRATFCRGEGHELHHAHWREVLAALTPARA